MVTAVGITAALAAAGLHLYLRMDDLQTRLSKLEAESRVLSPLITMMGASRPGPSVPHPYAAIQATGPANVAAPGADSPLAWCPASENDGIEWLELVYAEPVTASGLQIHATFNPGAIVRVLIGGSSGPLQELPLPPGPVPTVQTLPISPPMEISRVILELDTATVAGWNEIDAVALLDANGVPTWAASASASSHWTRPQVEE